MNKICTICADINYYYYNVNSIIIYCITILTYYGSVTINYIYIVIYYNKLYIYIDHIII